MTISRASFAAVAVALSAVGMRAWADPVAGAPPAAQTAPMSDAEKVKELEKRLDERDAEVRDLEQRVARLEQEQAAAHAAAGGAQGASVAANQPPPPAASQAPAPPAAPAAPAPTQSAQASGPPPPAAQGAQPPPQQQASSAPAKPGPGAFEVSEEAAQHALERALVQTGAALLPRGKFEFVPSLTYQFQQISQPGQIALTTSGSVLITDNVLRSTQLIGQGLLRAGLPWDFQVEVALPWEYKRNDIASRANGAGLSQTVEDNQGLDDVSVALTKQLLVENDQRPGIFAAVAWNGDFGQVRSSLPVGVGFDEVIGSLTVVKRQDPLVFTAGFAYQDYLERNGLRPGGQFIPSFGMLFAISPETSLQFAQQFQFAQKTTFHGLPIPGSDQTIGIFRIGLLSILGKGRVVNFSIGIGETPDSPNITAQVAFPIRLN